MDPSHIRNFAIIAHIDHGKSTLSDRLLELTGSLTSREMQAQVLDAMDLERERGITIKAHTVRMMYKAHDGETYQLNLIDTPGHVDFSYEVSRSLASCEGALLVVDASQGVEAQTLANAYLAISQRPRNHPHHQQDRSPQRRHRAHQGHDRKIRRPPGRRRHRRLRQDRPQRRRASSKPSSPSSRRRRATPTHPSRPSSSIAGSIPTKASSSSPASSTASSRKGMKIKVMSNDRRFEVDSMGVMTPKPVEILELTAGEVGFFVATIKNVADTKVGDTITDVDRPCAEPLPGFEDIKSMVFAGLYTVDSHEHGYAPRRPRKAPPQRRQLLLRARILRRPRLRLPLRLPRPAPPRNYSGAPRARVSTSTSSPPRPASATRSPSPTAPSSKSTTPPAGPIPPRSNQIEEPVIIAKILTNEEYVGNILKLVEDKARPPAEHRVRLRDPRHAHLRAPAQRDRPRLLRPPQVRLPRLRIARLQPRRPLDLPHGQDGHPHRRRPRRRALHHRPPRLRLRPRSAPSSRRCAN